MWTNLINGKRYIGSSVDLRIRFLQRRALNIPRPSIRKNLQSKNSTSYKGQYIFKLL
jgi:hypothetical protein